MEFLKGLFRLILSLAALVMLVGAMALVGYVNWGPGIDMTKERRLIEFAGTYAAAIVLFMGGVVAMTIERVVREA